MKISTKVNLIVLYSDARTALCEELSVFDLEFEEHQHGNGPIHDACEMDGLCLEIYPTSDTNPPSHTRIGLTIPDMDQAIRSAQSIEADLQVQPMPSHGESALLFN